MIEAVLFWTSLTLFLLYAGLHTLLIRGLIRPTAPKYDGPPQGISIIIAARNEERTIGPLLESLRELDYPADRFEVIVVNDRSTDRTHETVAAFRERFTQLTLIDLHENPTDMPHKKHALQNGIAKARFEILAFTDADCIVPRTWLHELSAHFTDGTGMVAGYSPYLPGTANAYLEYEEFKKTLLASSALFAGHPFLCTGRNFAYRKQIFTEVGGFEGIKHSVSGDDDLFMQWVHRNTRWGIRYMVSPESAVATLPPATFRQFIHQRTRHISASRSYSLIAQYGYTVVHLFHLILTAGFFLSPLTALIFLALKFNVDAVLLVCGMSLFSVRFTLPSFFVNETLLVLYSFLIGPLGYVNTFSWKGTRA